MTHPSLPRPGRRLRALVCSALVSSFAFTVAFGAAPTKKTYDLPADTAERAIKRLAEQSGVEVLFSSNVARAVRTNAVRGDFTPREALDQMLAGTGLVSAQDSATGALTVRREDYDPNGARAAAIESARPPASQNRTSEVVSKSDDTLILSPFEVTAEDDEGYRATSTLAGTRLRSDLKDLAASISVVTKDFMTDINATDITSLLVYTAGTEVGGYGGNFTGISDAAAGGGFEDALLQVSPATRSRGLIGADATRNYFRSEIPMDSYNLDRVEISRGANGLLFGLGSPAGIVNSGIVKADLRKNKSTASAAFGSYSSYRGTLDHNQVLIKDRLALRLNAVYDNTRYRIEDAFSKRRAVTLNLTVQPIKDLTVRVTSEYGRGDSNRPEVRPPFDRVTWWWAAGKPVWNPMANTGRLLGTPTAPFTATSILTATGTRVGSPVSYLSANWGGGTTNEPLLLYTDPNSSKVGGINVGGGQTVDGVKIFADNAYLNAAGTGLVAGGWLGLNSWFSVEQNIYQASNPLRALYTRDLQISDPRIFDYYHHMLSGPTKYEWNWYDSHNASIEKTFLNKRAGVEISFYKEHVDTGGVSPSNYALNLDINEFMPNGAPNPNFLRPLTLGGAFERTYSKDREAARITGYYTLDLRRVKGPRWLGQVLGTHQVNVNYTRDNALYQQFGGSMWNAGLDWNAANGQNPGTVSSTARIIAVGHYLGASVQNTATPFEMAIQAPTVGQNPAGPSMTILTNRRPAVTTPNALQPWTVDTYGLLVNPTHGVRYVRNASGYADRTEQQVRSTAAVFQSYWLNQSVVTTVGWRRDQAWSFDAGIPTANPAIGEAVTTWDLWYPKVTRTIEASSKNYGIVGHLPRFVREKLPLGTELSAFYNYATNLRIAPQRFTITGEALPSETGETKEYGLRFSTFHGKLDFKVTHYRSLADKATAGNLAGAIGQLAMVVPNVVAHNYNGDNLTNAAGIAQFESWTAGPYGQTFVNAFHAALTPNNDAGRPADTYGKYASANDDRGQITAVSALESTGLEFEMTFNPLKNWRISANATSAEAVRTKIAPELYDFMFNPNGGLVSLVSNSDGTPTAAGRLVGTPVGSGSGTLQAFVIGNIINNGVVTTFAQDGTKSDELRKWHYSATTNYSFTNEAFGGLLKGWGVGGAVRWSDRPLLGYAGKLITSGGTSLTVSDTTKPFLGPRETTFDAWLSYGRKLPHNIAWKAQLNVRNLGVGNELKPLGVWPDGTVVNWTIREPQKWMLTNTFSF